MPGNGLKTDFFWLLLQPLLCSGAILGHCGSWWCVCGEVCVQTRRERALVPARWGFSLPGGFPFLAFFWLVIGIRSTRQKRMGGVWPQGHWRCRVRPRRAQGSWVASSGVQEKCSAWWSLLQPFSVIEFRKQTSDFQGKNLDMASSFGICHARGAA